MCSLTVVPLFLFALGASAAHGRPQAAVGKSSVSPVSGVVDQYNLEKNYVRIRTQGGTVLPPIVLGKEVKLVVGEKGYTSLKELNPNEQKALLRAPVTIIFRGEGKWHVIDKVVCDPKQPDDGAAVIRNIGLPREAAVVGVPADLPRPAAKFPSERRDK